MSEIKPLAMIKFYKNTSVRSFFTILILFSSAVCLAQAQDSSKVESAKSKAIIKSTTRLHSKGMFAYGGRICADNPAFDINFVYERKNWGFFAFKAVDLADHQSPNNFTLAVLYKNFKLNDKLTFTPHAGAFLEQQHEFAGHGSDVALIAITAFKINSHFTVDHTTLFGNFIVEHDLRDWVNRIRFLYTSGHVDLTATMWHNNHVFDQGDYASGAITFGYSRVKMSKTFNLNFYVTDIVMVRSSNEESVPRENNVMFTLALQFVK